MSKQRLEEVKYQHQGHTVHWATAHPLISHLVFFTPTNGAVGGENTVINFTTVKERLTGKCLCTHALFLKVIYGREISWESIGLRLGMKKKRAFCHCRYTTCQITQRARGEVHGGQAVSAASLGHGKRQTPRLCSSCKGPRGSGLLPLQLQSHAHRFRGQSWGLGIALGPIKPETNSSAARAPVTLEGRWAPTHSVKACWTCPCPWADAPAQHPQLP